MAEMNRQWRLARRPAQAVTPDCFEWVECPLEPLEDGQVRVRNHWLSLDPYMRGRMDDARSYAPPQALGAVMQGGTAGEVVESRHADFKAGDEVVGRLGWQSFANVPARELRRIDTRRVPMQAWLGAVGMPGVTAWVGINDILSPQPGQTLVVSAASGAVGSVVGQLARARGARVIGIAGGQEKCRIVVNEFGFDACVDYKAGNLAADLDRTLGGARIDRLFENVGGACLDACLAQMNAFGRVAVCGLISGYNGEPIALANVRSILVNRLHVQGFIVSDHMERWAPALAELAELAASGKLRWRETIAEGLERAPEAFIGLLKGRNLGKQLVRI
ncbi:MAG: NADP-dependent oxidoreductase [Betaproteobacteria bacterium]|nr:NADP-dependent oxidoreductase [Betaproteobacteria bacterium]